MSDVKNGEPFVKSPLWNTATIKVRFYENGSFGWSMDESWAGSGSSGVACTMMQIAELFADGDLIANPKSGDFDMPSFDFDSHPESWKS